MLSTALQPTTQPGGGTALWWTGWAMVAGGGTLAALSGSIFKKYDSGALARVDPDLRSDCIAHDQGLFPFSSFVESNCARFRKPNRALLWSGIAIAGTGIGLALVGKSRQRSSVTFVPLPGGAAVFRSVAF